MGFAERLCDGCCAADAEHGDRVDGHDVQCGYSLLLQPLSYPESDRLVVLHQNHSDRGGYAELRFNPPDFFAVRRAARQLEVAGAVAWDPILTGHGETVRLRGQRISHDYLQLTSAATGLHFAWLLSSQLEALLFGVNPADSATGVVVLLVTVALVAAWIPARRITRNAPAVIRND